MTIKEILQKDVSFRYQLLSRMEVDCLYYLGNGGRCEKHLWAGNVPEQIEYMKAIYNSFPENEKPDWMTMEEILVYEQRMLEPVLSVEEFKVKQNEILLQYGGRLPEACETMNSLNLHFIRTHNGWMGGKLNGRVFEPYDGKQIYNFGYDFMVPGDIPILHKYMYEWSEQGKVSAIEKIWGCVKENGVMFSWS